MTETQFAQAPDQLAVRELQVGGKTLVTTLLCVRLTPKSELKSLYQQRWHIELNFRNRKTTMGLEILSSKRPAMAIKELWVYLLACNLVRRMMEQAAGIGGAAEQTEFRARAATLHGLPALFDPPRSRCQAHFSASHRETTGREKTWTHRATRDQTKAETLSAIDKTPPPPAQRITASRTPLMLKSVPFVSDNSFGQNDWRLSSRGASANRHRAQRAPAERRRHHRGYARRQRPAP
jgi:hypothetical protein